MRHILIKIPKNAGPELVAQAGKKAEELLAKIKGGAKFEDVARSDSEDQATADKGGDLGQVSRGTISPVLEQVILSLSRKKCPTR